jgi:predicted RNase H-like HicB family nuclease
MEIVTAGRDKMKAILEKGKDGYGVSFEGIPNIYGFGETVEASKKDTKEVLDFFIRTKDLHKLVPELLKGEYQLEFEFDTTTLLNYIGGTITPSALARASGINVAQISHYATGRRKPRPAQREKIVYGLHQIAHELLTVS